MSAVEIKVDDYQFWSVDALKEILDGEVKQETVPSWKLSLSKAFIF